MQHIRTHDGLFKFVFGEPEQMAELLRACLPAKVAAAIDWSTLTRVSSSFVDEQRIEDLRLSAVSSLTLRFLQFLRSCPSQNVAGYIRSWAPLIAFLTTHPRGQEVLFALLSWYTASSKATSTRCATS